jgi:hypothetical protein
MRLLVKGVGRLFVEGGEPIGQGKDETVCCGRPEAIHQGKDETICQGKEETI